MRTSKHSNARQGDVIAVQGPKGTCGYVTVTDPSAKGLCSPDGYECRDATPQEIHEAAKQGTMRYEG